MEIDALSELIATMRTIGAELARITIELQKYREDCRERDMRFREDMEIRRINMGQQAQRKFLDNQKRRSGDRHYGPPELVKDDEHT